MSAPATVTELARESAKFSLRDWGDEKERSHFDFIAREMPEYERFWQLFVFPFRAPRSVWIQLTLVPSHEAVCIYNYSIFRAGLRAFLLLSDARRRSSAGEEVGSDLFYDFCLWLDVAYERAGHLAGALYFYLREPSDIVKRKLNCWDDHAKKLDTFLDSDARQQLEDAAKGLRKYRNKIVHGPKFPGGLDRVPRSEHFDTLLYWSDWARTAAGPVDDWIRTTIPRLDVMGEHWKSFSRTLNEFLRRTRERTAAEITNLQDHNLVGLPDIANLAVRTDGTVYGNASQELMPSGTLFPAGAQKT